MESGYVQLTGFRAADRGGFHRGRQLNIIFESIEKA